MELVPRDVGLRLVSDRIPGIRRKRTGRAFTYADPDGTRIDDPDVLARIRALAIPPAYTDVWICPFASGHLQATGRDARGRKQYRYHKRWRAVRDENKFERTIAFGHVLPSIRARVDADLERNGFPRERVLAAVVWLLESTLIRVGNDEYARDNDSYGLTTLRDQHVRIVGDRLAFGFRGKSGIKHSVRARDRRVARIVRGCKDLPGKEIFSYLDDDGNAVDVKSEDVNAYLREISGGDFTAKDFRTWAATVACASALSDSDAPAATLKEAKASLTTTVSGVAQQLGNTATVCRKSYIHPSIIESYLKERTFSLPAVTHRARGLSSTERAVLAFLEHAEREAKTPLETKLRRSLPKSTRAALAKSA